LNIETTKVNDSSERQLAPTTNYQEKTGNDNPFDGISLGSNPGYATPVLVDIDGDGDLDLAIGKYTQASNVFDHPAPKLDNEVAERAVVVSTSNRSITYYQNDGTSTNPNYVEKTGTNNPLDGVRVGPSSWMSPSFGDVDGDGDLDLIVGDGYGYIAFYQNDGSVTNPNFVQKTGNDNPFAQIDADESERAPVLVDMDDDGDADLLVDSNGDGYLQYFQNDRSSAGANYVEKTGAANPFSNVYTGYGYSMPVFVDIDKDNVLEAIFGHYDGSVVFYEKTGNSYSAVSSANSPVSNVQVANDAAPAVGDIDDDGDIDILMGDRNGDVRFFEDIRTKATLTPFEGKDAFEVTSLGADNTLVLNVESIGALSEILIFKVDDADGSNPEQVGSLSALESGQLGDDFAQMLSLDSDSVEAGDFFEVQLVENGMTRSATVSRTSDGQLALDFGNGTVLTIQAGTENTGNLIIGDADGIDLGDSEDPMMLEFSVYREASYNNTLGLYTTDTADGGIRIGEDASVQERAPLDDSAETDSVTGMTLMPGDAGYKEAAMARRLDVTLTGENGKVQSFTAELSGEDQFLATFLIADGSDFNSEKIYFSHMGANSNGNDHVKYLGNNTFGYEDMAGLGDKDYNDIVVRVMATAQQNETPGF